MAHDLWLTGLDGKDLGIFFKCKIKSGLTDLFGTATSNHVPKVIVSIREEKIDSDVFEMSKNQKIYGIRHKIQTGRGIRIKYAPKEPQNQVEFETFSLTSPSGQLFGCEIEKKFEIHQNRHILHSAKLKKKIIIQIPCKFSEL